MLRFDWAQSFYVDASAVQNATEIALTRIDLFFRAKPPADGNKSGIYKPGAEIKIVPCSGGKPVINQVGAYRPTEPVEHGAKFAFYSGGQTARVEYDNIFPSLNALTPTTFLFQSPVFVPTNAEYAAVIKFDGAENFVLWSETTGDPLLGHPTIVSTGPSGNFRGTLFQFISDPAQTGAALSNSNYAYSKHVIDPAIANNAALVFSANSNPLESSDVTYLQANWSPILNQELKISIHAARYFINGQSVQVLEDYFGNTLLTSTADRPVILPPSASVLSNNIIRLAAPCQLTEYVLYNLRYSTRDTITYGETIYQDGPAYPGDKNPVTAICANNTVTGNAAYTFANGTTFNAAGGFATVFNVNDTLILKEVGGNNIFQRAVAEVISNTVLRVSASFPSTVTCTVRVAPTSQLHELSNTTMFNKKRNLMTLYNSMVNSTVRFVSYSIANATIAAAGTGYSNNDYVIITGFEDIDFGIKGNYAAYANVVTSGAGAITGVQFSNSGAGFVNSSFLVGSNVHIYQSTGGVTSVTPSSGTGANLVFNVSSNLKSLLGLTVFANCELINIEVHRMKPEIWVNNPLGTSFTIYHRTNYYSQKSLAAHNGKVYYADTDTEEQATDTLSKIYKSTNLNIPALDKTPVLTSRSNEFAIRYANGAINVANNWGQPHSNTAVFIFDISSNNDYQAVWFDPEVIVSHYAKYIINDEYTNEHTNYGEAVAKHCATRINLQTGMTSEDVVVYLDAYRPSNTDIKVYARLKNSFDPDAFDDLDWTLLEQTDGIGLYSSRSDDSDYKELTYNLPAYPNTDFQMAGTVTLKQGNAHVIGSGTTFQPNTTITSGGTGYTNGDIVSFTAPHLLTDDALQDIFAYRASVDATATVATNPSGVITGLTLTNQGYGWTSQIGVTSFTVKKATGAPSAGTGASLSFKPGLQVNDLIKIYSPYEAWANANYTTAVVNTVISNTDVIISRIYGELGPNLPGLVNISAACTHLIGTGTTFQVDFSTGDLIAVWANASVYEVKSVTAITSNTDLTMDSLGSFSNATTFHATVLPETFMNTSLNVSNLLIDRIAYPHQAFNNMGNDNVSRYYNTSMTQFDGYNTMQLKVVLLSDNDNIVPKVDDVRGVLVSA